MYKQENLLRDHGDLKVQVSDIPYSEKFGSDQHVDKTLAEYIEEVKQHNVEGGRHPWYVFKGNSIPRMSDTKDSLVRIQDCPTPRAIQAAFERTASVSMRGKGGGVEARKIFVNAQWALGGVGTGAPIHYHNSAWYVVVLLVGGPSFNTRNRCVPPCVQELPHLRGQAVDDVPAAQHDHEQATDPGVHRDRHDRVRAQGHPPYHVRANRGRRDDRA
jgi:hypothetical protein